MNASARAVEESLFALNHQAAFSSSGSAGILADSGLTDCSCVSRWEDFTRFVVRGSPVLIVLALLGRKGTRILVALATVAMAFDCVMIDMMQ